MPRFSIIPATAQISRRQPTSASGATKRSDLRQDVGRLPQMRAVAAVGHQPRLAIAADLAGDDAELQLAAVFVVLALDRLHRHDDAGQAAVGIHRLEAGRQPGVRPQVKGAVDIVAVIFRRRWRSSPAAKASRACRDGCRRRPAR